MAVIASDTFDGLATDISVSGRTLDNGLGGSSSVAWAGTSDTLLSNGSNRLKGNTASAYNIVQLTGVKKARVRFDPSGGTSNIAVYGLCDLMSGPLAGNGLLVLLAADHTSLRVASKTAGSRTDHQSLAVTAPAAPFWLEIEIDQTAKVLTGRILNDDTSVRNTVSHTFTTVPSGGNYWGMSFYLAGNTGTFDDFVIDDGAAGDTEAPTLTGSITIGTKTTSSIAMSWPAGSDNVAVTSYEVSSNGGSSWTDVGNVLTYTFTGLSSGTSYNLRVRAKDAAGNVSTPALAATESTLASDSTPPTMNGSITVGTKTSGSISISYPAASDNVAVTGYEVRVNGGTWLDNGTSLSYTALGLAALTSCTLDVRAYDGAGNRAVTPLSVTTSTYRAGDTAANIIANTGPVGGNPAGFLYAFASTVTSTDWLSYTIVSGPTPAGGTLTANPDGTFTYFGPEPASLVIQPEVNGANAAETITVTLYDQTGELPDTDPPVLSAATAYASSATTAAGTVTTNEATGTLYFLRNNSATATDVAVKAGLSQAVTAAGIQTVNVTGLTASTPGNYIHYLHQDGSGNDSLVSSSTAFTTPAPPAPGMKVTGAKPTKVSARPIARPIAGKPTD